MRLRPALTAVCALAVALAGGAVAAPPKPKPLCKLVVDPANDLLPGRPYDGSLDVVSADVANNATTLTGVIRLAKLAAEDLMAPSRIYTLEYRMRSTGIGGNLYVQITPTGVRWQNGAGTGVIDLAKSEIRISVPISRLVGHPLFKAGDALTALNVHVDLTPPVIPGSEQQLPIGVTADLGGDRAVGTKDYPVGAPTCVKVGA